MNEEKLKSEIKKLVEKYEKKTGNEINYIDVVKENNIGFNKNPTTQIIIKKK